MDGHIDTDDGTDDEILLLDAEDLWNRRRFRRKLLASLAADGFVEESRVLVERLFNESSTPDFASFETAAASLAPSLGPADAARLGAVVDHWRRIREHNLSVYRPHTPAEYKSRRWPNNPKVLETQWELYEDIHEADLFVDTHRFITKETAIASAGSCFAANISRQLQYWGYNYILEMTPPGRGDYPTDPASCGNIYNALSMRQMVERAFGEWTPEKILIATRPGYLDPFRSIVDYDSIDGYLDRWHEHGDALKRALGRCEVFILTLGMTEAWVFGDSGYATTTSPKRGDPTLLRHRNLSLEDNVRELEKLHEVFKRHNPGVRFIATVSPVPLNSTFNTDRHVVVANGLSKSILRVALEEFARRHPEDVTYFPAYEIVTTATREPWDIDMRHVSNAAVTRVMRQFQKVFMVDQSPLPILAAQSMAEFIPQKRNYALRYAREWVVHPVKRALGIEGRPFRALLSR